MRSLLTRLVGLAGFRYAACKTGKHGLENVDPDRHGCILIDLSLPDMSGLELRDRLLAKGCRQPFLIVTGHGSAAAAVRALHAGAIDFLEKPLDRQILLNGVRDAIERDWHARSLQLRLEKLTPREREILVLLVAGEATKPIARRLEIAPSTVDVHRHRILKKMEVPSLPHLVRVWMRHRDHP